MRFGRYELLSRLGAGGMGEVWRARDQELHRDVAVKFLPEKYAADPNRFSRFTQEALAASRLNHPNIITIHDNGQTSGLHYIVMELVEGETLREVLLAQGERSLSVRRLLDIGAQIADGLAKAHADGIVHRDLKPENVMVTSDGFVKVLDFGLVKLRGDGSGGHEQWFDSAAPTWPDSPSPQTAVGVVLGTAGYMSPEQARGRAVDHRSDQFALGAILYELATGRQPFRRETPAQTIAAIIDATPEPLATLNPALPPPARWIIERCLAKDPAERYASTLDLARECERAAHQWLTSSSRRGSRALARRRRLAVFGLTAASSWPRRGSGRRCWTGRGDPAAAGGTRRQAHRRPLPGARGGPEDKAWPGGIVDSSPCASGLQRIRARCGWA
jgi:serine/threonine protein kinase